MALPKMLEYKEMIGQRDNRTIILWIIAVFAPAIIYMLNPQIDKKYLLGELPMLFVINHYRANFLIKFDDAVDSCFKKILQENIDTKEPLEFIVRRIFSNSTFNGVPISKPFESIIAKKLNDHFDELLKKERRIYSKQRDR